MKAKPNKKVFFIIALIIAAAAAAFFIIRRKRKVEGLSNRAPAKNYSSVRPGKEAPPSQVEPAATASDFPLKRGSRGKYVTVIQQHMKDKHRQPLKVDGIFGPKTEAALKKVYGITVIDTISQFNSLFKK